MSIIPTMLRALVIGVASVVPENSPLDSVVFRSSLQILIGVVYVTIFYVVSALVRVLMGRHALVDPTESVDLHRYNVRYDVEDLYEYSANQGGHTQRKQPRPSEELYPDQSGGKSSGSIASGSATMLVRVGRGMERRVSRIAPKLKRVVDNITSVMIPSSPGDGRHVDADDHSPARHRAGSVDGALSESSSSSMSDFAAGVEPRMHVRRLGVRTDKTRIHATDALMDPTISTDTPLKMRVFPDARMDPTDTSLKQRVLPVQKIVAETADDTIQSRDADRPYSDPDYPHVSVPIVTRGYRGGVYEHDNVTGVVSDRIYTDVYGLGFAAFVLHYTMDCSSMQPTMFLLVGLTMLGARDVSVIATSVVDNMLPQATLFTRALTVFSFILLVVAQICMLMGIVRVPTYHTSARDGGITLIPAPETILEHCLARVLPTIAPLALYMVSKKTGVISNVAKTLSRAMPTTVLMALWFITCFGAMSDQIRNAVGAISVNMTVTELTETDVSVNMQLPLLILSPIVKIPALLAIISCCLTRKTMDVVAALCVVFYAKQIHVVQDVEMVQMINVAFMCACMAWFCLTLRYCTPVVHAVANLFEPKNVAA